MYGGVFNARNFSASFWFLCRGLVSGDRGWVRFVAESRKGAAEDNLLPIAADTREALAELRAKSRRRKGIVFEWPYHPTYIYNRLGRIMRRAGLPDTREYKFHVVRKAVASHYEAAGGNATALLKHSSRKVTEAYLGNDLLDATQLDIE